MASANELALLLTAKDQGASKVIKDVQKGVGGLGKVLGDVSKIAGGFVLAKGILAAPSAIGSFTNAASDLNETLSKSNTVFKGNAGEIEKWASGASKGFGQSKQQALDAAGSFGNLFTQIGISTPKAAQMSKAMVELASDFASFHNADITEVLTAQQAAFRGEYDALQRFVPTINAAAVEQKAMAMTGKDNAKSLTIQEKALATQKLMLEGAGEAMGDFDRTSSGLANRQRILSAQFADMQANIGQKLLPVMVGLAGFVLDSVIPALESLGDWIGPKIGAAVAFIAPIFETLKLSVLAMFAAFSGQGITSDGMVGTFERIGEAARSVVSWIQGQIPAAVAFLQGKFAEIKVYVDSDLKPAFDGIVSAVKSVIDFIQANWPTIMTVIQPVIDQIVSRITLVYEVITNLIALVVDLIQGDWAGAWGNAKDIFNAFVKYIHDTLGQIGALIEAVAPLALAGAKVLGSAILEGLVIGLKAIPGLVEDVGSAIVKVIKGVINDEVIDRINRSLEFKVDLGPAGSLGIDPPDIPHLAKGGITRGPTLAMIGDNPGGREAVIPLGPGQSGLGPNVTVNVYGSIHSDGDIVAIIRDAILGGGFRGVLSGA